MGRGGLRDKGGGIREGRSHKNRRPPHGRPSHVLPQRHYRTRRQNVRARHPGRAPARTLLTKIANQLSHTKHVQVLVQTVGCREPTKLLTTAGHRHDEHAYASQRERPCRTPNPARIARRSASLNQLFSSDLSANPLGKAAAPECALERKFSQGQLSRCCRSSRAQTSRAAASTRA